MIDILVYWVTFILASCGLIYWLMTKDVDYWEKRSVYCLKPKLIFGNIKDMALCRISYHDFQKKMYFEFKGHPYAGIFEGRSPKLVLMDPEIIKQILVRDFDHYVDRRIEPFKSPRYIEKMMIMLTGDEWKHMRITLSPTFSTGKIKILLDLVNTCGKQLVTHINEVIMNNDGISTGALEIKGTMAKFTTDVIATCAFGVQCDSLKDNDSVFLNQISKFYDLPLWKRIVSAVILVCQLPFSLTHRLPLSYINDTSVQFLANMLKDTVKYRQQNNVRRNDFLQLVMDVEKGNDVKASKHTKEQNSQRSKVMDEDKMIAQCILFFIAGYETTSILLTMTCYLLAQHKEEQNRVKQEIKTVLLKHGGKITYEVISDMPYLEMVLSEVLRMYPPVASIGRTCTETHRIGDLDVEKGMKISIPVIGMHYDPDHFPEPETFRPERFSPEGKEGRHPYAYLPFGHGPRNCIGMRFSQMVSKICMVYLLREFYVDICKETVIPFAYHKNSLFLKSEHGVWLQISKEPQNET